MKDFNSWFAPMDKLAGGIVDFSGNVASNTGNFSAFIVFGFALILFIVIFIIVLNRLKR